MTHSLVRAQKPSLFERDGTNVKTSVSFVGRGFPDAPRGENPKIAFPHANPHTLSAET